MNRFRVTQAGGRTFIEKMPQLSAEGPYPIKSRNAFLTLYGAHVRPGCGEHRKDYSDIDATWVAEWLNEREAGYPRLAYLLDHWKREDYKAGRR